MNPTATARFRRATALLALAWALLALGLAVAVRLADNDLGPPFVFDGIVTDPWRLAEVSPEARAAGVSGGDRVLSIDGQQLERMAFRWDEFFERERPNRYEVEKGGGTRIDVALRPVRTSELVSPLRKVFSLALPLVGLVYLAVGVAVWRFRPERSESWALLLFCAAMGTALALPWQPGGAAWLMYWTTLPLIGATAFHLFTSYPIEPTWIVRKPGLRLAPYLAAAPIGLLAAAEGPLGWPLGIGKVVALWFTIALVFGCVGVALYERARVRDTHARERADIMLLGSLVSFTPGVAVLMAESFVRTPFPWYLGFLSFFVFPVAVGYGIVRKQLFHIRLMARSSASYGAATLAITGLYASLIVFADAMFSRYNVNARSPWFSVLFLFLAILAFNPLRSRMQRLVDRIFDRDHALYRQAVQEISEAMIAMLSTVEVVDRILVALTETMGVQRAVVLLQEEQGRRIVPAASRGEWDDESLGVEIPLAHPLCRRLLSGRDVVARGDFDHEEDIEVREACRDVFDQLEVELLVPILFGADLLGVIGVGHKLSGDRLSGDDHQLLLTLANQSSIAIENARAFDEIATLNATLEARVDERTRELREAQLQLLQSEKMRSLGQLVAGVAHELNNPIGFVHANLHLLQEQMRRLIQAERSGDDSSRAETAIEKLLLRSREGTDRVKQIVADLRTFSRMDQAELVDVDLNEEIERTLGLMAPRFRHGIEIVRDYGELPKVRCFAGQLNQVFMNLLMNAGDALDGSGHIRIKTRARSGGVRLEFHDDGPGIPPEVQARIFEPFFTTKPVGQGTGLGLSISYGIVERHGGRMLLGSALGQGTTFVIELPLEASPPAADEVREAWV
ncbi:MAG: ATP-binding protein [Myxococcota bacterium]|nr:ATP-binding protein [Myxococcota bacterium]